MVMGMLDSVFLFVIVLLIFVFFGVGGDFVVDGMIFNKLCFVIINVVNESGKLIDEFNGINDVNILVVGGIFEVVLECVVIVVVECEVSNYNFIWQMVDVGILDKFIDLNNINVEKYKYIIKGIEQNKLFCVYVMFKMMKVMLENKCVICC